MNRRWAVVGGGLALLAYIGTHAAGMLPSGRPAKHYTTVPVRSGPLRISVTDEGQIDSLNNAVVDNQVEWRTKILWVIPEGTAVEKGDVICELDASALEEKLKEREILLTRAIASHNQAKETLEIQKSKNERDISAAELQVEMAELDLEEYRDGTYEQELLQLQNASTLAAENLSRSQEQYLYAKRLSQKGYKTQSDLEAARLALTKSQVSLQTANEKLRLLDDYTAKRKLAELEGNARESKFELARVKLRAGMLLAQAQVRVSANERSVLIHQNYYDRLRRNIEACTIRAPRSGGVVYASSRHRRYRGTIEAGEEVRHRQELFALPDLSQLKVEVKVHETQIGRISRGQRVLVRVDAVSNTIYEGRIHDIAALPKQGRFPNMDLREYTVVVKIEEEGERLAKLKPGLTAAVEIILEQYANAVQVPARSVLNLGDHCIAYVMTPQGPEPRHVEIGSSDDKVVVVESGLEVGEEVVESPRTELAQELIELQEEFQRSDG